MAITKYEEYTERRPVGFTCDVCKTCFELDSEYDRKYKSNVKDQMAVLKYSYPAGGWCERTETAEVHCCSLKCLASAMLKVPYDAQISIPAGGIYHANE